MSAKKTTNARTEISTVKKQEKKIESLLQHGLVLERQLQQKEQDLLVVREQHQLIFRTNQAYEEGNMFLRGKVEKLETTAADYKAKLVAAGLEPETPPSAEQQKAAMFAATRAEAQEEAMKSMRQDRLLLLERLRQAEKLLRDAREFVPNPDSIDAYLSQE